MSSPSYKKITFSIQEKLRKIVGEKNIISDPERMCDYSHDEISLREIRRLPEIVVRPKSEEEISSILRLACQEGIPVTPRGGGTGLCGGCVPVFGGILLSLENMNRVLEIDSENQMVVVEAGVTLREFCERVEEAGFYFPPHPGDESAMIGGLIATNAGGSRAVKYGTIRNYIRGLKVVLASGEIIQLGGKLIKSSTGYNLLHLFIGSEGTLGVVTQATIQLLFRPPLARSLIIPFDSIENTIETVPLISKARINPVAVEFIEEEVIRITEEYLKKKWPCTQGKTYLLIILDASSEEELDQFSARIAEICFGKGALDVFIASSAKQQDHVLEIRSKIYEAIKSQTVEILDISLPPSQIPLHVKKVHELSEKYGLWLPTFGHAADGNVHTHIMKAHYEQRQLVELAEEEWREKHEKIREELYLDGRGRGGVISGEHGIGLVKKPFLAFNLGEEQVKLMKGIKKVFDPFNILNPGKIFDLDEES